MAVIEVRNLKYRYPHSKKLALDNVTFSVEKGEFIGIVGENGAGKSTLCQALTGLVPSFYKGAYGGRVLVGGMDTEKAPTYEICKKVGLIFQNPFNQLSGAKDSVYEEIAFGLQNLGVARDQMKARVDSALELMDIVPYRDRNPFDLSGGQMQRVAIASILAMEPEIVILDEPTSQLDPEGSEEVFRAVDTLAKSGITILMVEQKMEKLAAYCDKLLLFHDGKLCGYDKPEKIFSRPDLLELGVEAPVYTRISQKLNIVREDGAYPCDLHGLLNFKALFSERIDEYRNRQKKGMAEKEKPEGTWNVDKSKICIDHIATEHLPDHGGDVLGYGRKCFQIEDLYFHYRKNIPLLCGLNLTFDRKPTAIIGQNGAGKTTLVKLMKGLLKPVSGKIMYGGEDISGRTVAMLAPDIGYVFQNPDDQIFKYHVMDEVMFGPLNIGMAKDKAEEQALWALKTVGLTEKKDENPYDLELSERKMVAVASVLAMDTDVIILDEPTIAQDYKGRQKMKEIILNLSSRGKFILSILHDMDFVASCFERVIVMLQGEVLLSGTPGEVFQNDFVLKEARLELPHVMQFGKEIGRFEPCDMYIF